MPRPLQHAYLLVLGTEDYSSDFVVSKACDMPAVKQLSSLAFSPDGSELAVTVGHKVTSVCLYNLKH